MALKKERRGNVEEYVEYVGGCAFWCVNMNFKNIADMYDVGPTSLLCC